MYTSARPLQCGCRPAGGPRALPNPPPAPPLPPRQPGRARRRHSVPRIQRRALVRLGQRRIVEGVLDEIIERAFQVQHGLTDMHQLRRALAHDMHAQQMPCLDREDHLRQAGVQPHDVPARRLAETRDTALIGNGRARAPAPRSARPSRFPAPNGCHRERTPARAASARRRNGNSGTGSGSHHAVLPQEAQQRQQRQPQDRRVLALDPLEQMHPQPFKPIGADA